MYDIKGEYNVGHQLLQYLFQCIGKRSKNASELDKVLRLVEQFENIHSISQAKKYLENIWNINETVSEYPIGGNCILNTKESDKGFSVNFVYQDENVTYYYRK